jgi:16S rRNA (cytosine967-C5)-methyltransferase
MTPGARLAAAIGILDRILDGEGAEPALIRWARQNRYAGSGDRAAIRDIVFDGLRRKRSAAALGGVMSGRGIVLGLVLQQGQDPDTLFTGTGYAPPVLSGAERQVIERPVGASPDVEHDVQDWVWDILCADHGEAAPAIAQALRDRAEVHLRVNLAQADRDTARVRLSEQGIETAPHPLAHTALRVIGPDRKLRQSAAFQTGLVEFQDAASQHAVTALGPLKGLTVLDYCAGGGGKSLAVAAAGARVTAHDAAPDRMSDLADRAARAGARIDVCPPDRLEAGRRFDLVLVDAPCSGSGAWRRSPDAKWRMTPGDLSAYVALQGQILNKAVQYCRPGGRLAYATCSLFRAENAAQAARASSELPLRLLHDRQLTPLDGGDGFYISVFEVLENNQGLQSPAN